MPKYKKQKTKMDEVAETMSKVFSQRGNSTPAANTKKFTLHKKSEVLATVDIPSPALELKTVKLKKHTSVVSPTVKP